jgi:hypothetical protein
MWIPIPGIGVLRGVIEITVKGAVLFNKGIKAPNIVKYIFILFNVVCRFCNLLILLLIKVIVLFLKLVAIVVVSGVLAVSI